MEGKRVNQGLSPGGDNLPCMNSTEQLPHLLEDVSDQKSFLQFVEALIADRKSAVKAEKEHPANPMWVCGV